MILIFLFRETLRQRSGIGFRSQYNFVLIILCTSHVPRYYVQHTKSYETLNLHLSVAEDRKVATYARSSN
jgi:hypothetical protein